MLKKTVIELKQLLKGTGNIPSYGVKITTPPNVKSSKEIALCMYGVHTNQDCIPNNVINGQLVTVFNYDGTYAVTHEQFFRFFLEKNYMKYLPTIDRHELEWRVGNVGHYYLINKNELQSFDKIIEILMKEN